MSTESFFLSREAWAARKSALLSGFLEHFRTGNQGCNEFYCIDTFSYPTPVNGPKHQTLDRTARAVGASPKGIGVKLIKVATGKRAAAAVCGSSELPSAAVGTMEGQLEKIFPRILSIIGGKPAMLFIDPSSLPTLSFNALKPILRRKQRDTEIIIKFDAEAIWQRALESCLGQCGHTNRCTSVLRQLARILGLDKLKHVSSAGPGAALVKNYMDQITEFGFMAVAHCIRDAVGIRSNSYLIYCTRQPRNIVVLNDLIRSTEDRLLTEFLDRRGVGHPDDALGADVFLRRQELKHLMSDLKKGSEAVNLRDNEWRILCERFGEFHQNDFAIDVSD
ncbi:MAG TPA: hypothetical protein VN956_03445 [Pyrinomonadaceae bacterium]|nr:hypothetical protein [Pyrinomonadaceae bacterium]